MEHNQTVIPAAAEALSKWDGGRVRRRRRGEVGLLTPSPVFGVRGITPRKFVKIQV